MRNRYVGPVHLPADVYQRLEQRAKAEERDTLQQARYLLKQALADRPQAAASPASAIKAAKAKEAQP